MTCKSDSNGRKTRLRSGITAVHSTREQFRAGYEGGISINAPFSYSATYDYEAKRAGDRVCSVGEKPFLDVNSTGRKESLVAEGAEW
jgi:hypothetical protein